MALKRSEVIKIKYFSVECEYTVYLQDWSCPGIKLGGICEKCN